MEIFFCDRCGRRVTEAEIERQEAAVLETEIYCKICLRGDPELQARVKGAAAAHGGPPRAKHPSSTVLPAAKRKTGEIAFPEQGAASTTHKQKRSTAMMEMPHMEGVESVSEMKGANRTALVIAGVLLVLGLLGLGVVLLSGGGGSAPTPTTILKNVPQAPTTTQVPSTPATTPQTPATPLNRPRAVPTATVAKEVKLESFEGGTGYALTGWYRTYGRYDSEYVVACDGAGRVEVSCRLSSGNMPPTIGLACRSDASVDLNVDIVSDGGSARGTLNVSPGRWRGYTLSPQKISGTTSGLVTKVMVSGEVASEANLMIDALRVAVGYDEQSVAATYSEVAYADGNFAATVSVGNRPPLGGKFFWVNALEDDASAQSMVKGSMSGGGFRNGKAAKMAFADGLSEITLRGTPLIPAAPRSAYWGMLIHSPTAGKIDVLTEVCDRENNERYWLGATGISVKEGWTPVVVRLGDMYVNKEESETPPRVPGEIIIRGIHVKWEIEGASPPPEVLVNDIVLAGNTSPGKLAEWLGGTTALPSATWTPPVIVQPAVKGQPPGTIFWCGYEPTEATPKTLYDGPRSVPDGYPGIAQGLTVNDATNRNFRIALRLVGEPNQYDKPLCAAGPDAVLVFAGRSKQNATIFVEMDGPKSNRFSPRFNFNKPLTNDWQVYGFRLKDMGSNYPNGRYPAAGAPVAWIDFRSDTGPFEIDSVGIYNDGDAQTRVAELKQWIENQIKGVGVESAGRIIFDYDAEKPLPQFDISKPDIVTGGSPISSGHAFDSKKKDLGGNETVYEVLLRNNNDHPWFEVGPDALIGVLLKADAPTQVKFEVEVTNGRDEIYQVVGRKDIATAWIPVIVPFSGKDMEIQGNTPPGGTIPSGTKVKGLKIWTRGTNQHVLADDIIAAEGVTRQQMEDYLTGKIASLIIQRPTAAGTVLNAQLRPGKYQSAGTEIEVLIADDLSDGNSMLSGGDVKKDMGGITGPGGGSYVSARATTNALRYGFSLTWKNRDETLFTAGRKTFIVFNYYFDSMGEIVLNAMNSSRRIGERYQVDNTKKKEWATVVAELGLFDPASGDRAKRVQPGDTITEFKILAGVKGQGGVFLVHNLMIVEGDKDAVTVFAEALKATGTTGATTGTTTPTAAPVVAPARPLNVETAGVLKGFTFKTPRAGANLVVRSSKAAVRYGALDNHIGILIEAPQDPGATSAGRVEIPLPEPIALSKAGGAAIAITGKGIGGCTCTLGTILNNDSSSVDLITKDAIRVRDDSPRLYWVPIDPARVADKSNVDKLVLYFNGGGNPKTAQFSMLVEGISFTNTRIERILDFEGTGDRLKGTSELTGCLVRTVEGEAYSGYKSLSMQGAPTERPYFYIDLDPPPMTKGIQSVYLALKLEADAPVNLSFHPSSNGLWDFFMVGENGFDYIELKPGDWTLLHLVPNDKARRDLDTRQSPNRIKVDVWGVSEKTAKIWIDDFFVER